MTADIIAIPRGSLHDQVASRLRQMLVEGRIRPGAKLNERELCEVLEVSRTPLREAIKMLAAEGLVELVPHRGAIAVELDEQAVRNTFEVMGGLEALSGELAAQRITDAELAEIRAMHFEMLAAFTRRDLPAYYRLNARIHSAINAAAKNPVLAATYERINARLQALRFRSNQDEQKWKVAIREHEAMIDALAARDPAAMRRVLAIHLKNKLDVVLEQLHAGRDQLPTGSTS
ncbi:MULTISPECIES: GntR family transcriptional regulator [Ramlibacter]|jgi:DNA-binding GntR family transcriptional regulator|uniref:FCD domain-containing protein n=1 Tax=Ramlibacter pinisoli TaxID=2682844 RepID=A0A6N8IZI5_9BURK|nr:MULTISPECIES: GntR family transcriptional regulator [Ramlibacter]MBA2961507.1 GntR family transcriptional regulator [Ramlibacter sp. CGMCC 1.13660]MVQ31450.1 FCD domain-containing protein [Ramlibacter pinisoli]